MYHTDILKEFLKQYLVEVRYVEELKGGRHGVLGDDIRSESSICHTQQHRLTQNVEFVDPLAQLQKRLLDDFLLQAKDVTAGEVWSGGRSAQLVKVMLDSVGRGMRMSELVGVPAVSTKLSIVLNFVIESRIVNIQFIRIDLDDWSYLYSAHTLPSNQGSYHIPHTSSKRFTGTGPS